MNKIKSIGIHIKIYGDFISKESALILISKFISAGDKGVVQFGDDTYVGKREYRKSDCYYVWKDEEELI